MSSSEAALFRGDRLRRIRKKRALSQRELAEMVGWETGASVGHLERARRSEVPLARLRALAAALIVTPEWLLGEGADEDYDKDANGATEQSATIVPFQSDPDLDELVGLYLAMNPAERAALLRVARSQPASSQRQKGRHASAPKQLRARERREQS